MRRTTKDNRVTSGVKKPYEELTDLEKVQKQWHKLSGLHTREEWSAAIIRAATAAEIAANFAIRREFSATNLSPEFVNTLMRWANGLTGKTEKLLIPISANSKNAKKMKALKSLAKKVADKRNAIAHQGEFCNEDEAKEAIAQAREFITGLVGIYDASFKLADRTD